MQGLPAGRYRLPGFEPAITVELDGSWQSSAVQDGYSSLTQISRPPANPYRAGTFVAIARVQEVVGPDSGAEPTTASAAVATIAADPRIDVAEVGETRIGGRAGSLIMVQWPGDLGGPRAVALIIGAPPGGLGVEPGDRMWIACFDTEHGVIATIVSGPIEGWDPQFAAAEPVLDQLTFGLP